MDGQVAAIDETRKRTWFMRFLTFFLGHFTSDGISLYDFNFLSNISILFMIIESGSSQTIGANRKEEAKEFQLRFCCVKLNCLCNNNPLSSNRWFAVLFFLYYFYILCSVRYSLDSLSCFLFFLSYFFFGKEADEYQAQERKHERN